MTLVIPVGEKRFDPDAFLANIAKPRDLRAASPEDTEFSCGAIRQFSL